MLAQDQRSCQFESRLAATLNIKHHAMTLLNSSSIWDADSGMGTVNSHHCIDDPDCKTDNLGLSRFNHTNHVMNEPGLKSLQSH